MPETGWLSRVGPWVGIGTSPAALMAGGGVADGMSGATLAVAIVVGVLVLAALATAQGLLGQRHRAPLLTLTAGPLGSRASRATASVAMLGMMLGWFAVNVSAAGIALGHLTGLPGRLGMALMAAACLALVWGGIGRLSWAALAAGAATVLLAAYGLGVVLGEREVSLTGAVGDPMSPVEGVAVMVGYGAAFALRTPDFTSGLRRPRDVVLSAALGLAAPVAAFALVGAVLEKSTGSFDLSRVLRDLGSPTVAYAFVALGFAGSIMTNIWSGALSLTDALPRVRPRHAIVTVAAVGTALAALEFSQWLLPYLAVMALSAPPLIAVLLTHEAVGATHPRGGPAWHGPGLAAWGAGMAAGLGLFALGSALAFPVGLGTASLAYVLGTRLSADSRGGASSSMQRRDR